MVFVDKNKESNTFTDKSRTEQTEAEVDFIFSDGSDFLFSDSSDFVFKEFVEKLTWTDKSKL